jgi:uncharacterized membrane protein YraQ (UPF0718 family)
MALLIELLREFWNVIVQMAPYLLLGFFLAGLMHTMLPTDWIARQLGGKGWWAVVKASLYGVPAPLCSCGVLPVTAQLRKAGASKGAAASFLISAPETGVDSIVVTYGMLGPVFATFRVLAAFFNGILGGMLVSRFGGDEVFDSSTTLQRQTCCSTPPASASLKPSCCSSQVSSPGEDVVRKPLPLQRITDALRHGFVTLPRDLAGPLMVGLFLAAVLTLLGQWIMPALSGVGPVTGILLAMLIGLPMYVCSTASVPVAASLVFNAGLSPGAAMAFMISGPATNAAALTTLWRILGPRSTVIYLASIAVCAFGAGLLLDRVFMPPGHAGCVTHAMPGNPLVLDSLAVTLLVLLALPLFQRGMAWLGARRNTADRSRIESSPMTGATSAPDRACCCNCDSVSHPVAAQPSGHGLKMTRHGHPLPVSGNTGSEQRK